MELGIAIATFVVSIITALFVYLKNPKSGSNVYFGLLIFFISIYPIVNYLAVHSESNEQALFWAKMILLVSIPQGPLLYFFSETFPSTKFIFNRRRQLIILTWAISNAIFSIFGLIFAGVSVKNEIVSIEPGLLIFSFGLLHTLSIIAGLSVLYLKSRRSIAKQRTQLRVIYYGILISFSMTFLITFVLPVFMQNTILLAVSPLFLALSVVVVAYAIVAKRLFDIRSAVARSMAYLLALITLVVIYVFIVFAITQIAFTSKNVLLTHVFYLLGVVGLAISFHPLKVYFDKITDKFFYRDSYDVHEVLDSLGEVITNEVKLSHLVEGTMTILRSSLKASFVGLYLVGKNGVIEHRFKVGHDVDRKVLENAIAALMHRNQSLVEVDDLQDEDPTAYAALQRADVRFATRLDNSTATIGYIVFGYKQNGDVYGKKDINTAAVARDELAVAIQNALRFEEIQKFNETLQAKVDEATTELKKSNEKLKSLDKAKDEFVSMASHQLRTPLTSIKGYVSMVLDGDAGELNPAQRKLLEESYASSQRMVYLIGDFLNVSRLNTGKFMLEPSEVNIAEVVREEVEQLRATATSRHITLHYSKPASFLSMTVDETKIRQVVMNFIDNAIFYSRPDGDVRVEITHTGHEVVFKVKDSGIGVPAKERHHLFTKFYRASNARKARPDGTGIGLFMAKKVIVAHGGTIIFETKEGEGSTFGFSLPITKSRGTADTK